MKGLVFCFEGIMGGVCISLGAYVNVRAGGIVGAALFAFGLTAIILSRYKLFTGMIGFCESGADVLRSYYGLLLNAVGCAVMGLCLGGAHASVSGVVSGIVEARLGLSLGHVFVLAVCCGMIMTIAVKYAREGKFLPLCLGIPLFIMAGFLHCVADAFYYFAAVDLITPRLLLVWFITILGNTVGCNLPTLVGKLQSKN